MSEALSTFAAQVQRDSFRVSTLERAIEWLRNATSVDLELSVSTNTKFASSVMGYAEGMEMLAAFFKDQGTEALRQTLFAAEAELDVLRAKYAPLVPQLAADAEEQAR